jgi:hypothetical protein
MKTVKNKPKNKESKLEKNVINALMPYFEYKNKKGVVIKYLL